MAHPTETASTSVTSINARIEKRNIGGLLWAAFYRSRPKANRAVLHWGYCSGSRTVDTERSMGTWLICFCATTDRTIHQEVFPACLVLRHQEFPNGITTG